MKKLLIFIPLFMFAANGLFAQDDELPPPSSKTKADEQAPLNKNSRPDDKKEFQGFTKKKKIDLSKFIIEPVFNFNIGGNEVDLGLSPYVGYKVWKELFVGAGITYLYTGFHNLGFTDTRGNVYYANAKYNTIGGGVFAQYNIWKGFFARVKFELMYRDIDNIYAGYVQSNLTNGTTQVVIPKIYATIPDLLVGAGYNLLKSKNFFFPIVVSYNLLYSATNTQYSVYPHGFVIQLGFVNVF